MNEAVLALIALNVLFAQAFYLTYMTGQMLFGHAAFASIGAYTAGMLTTKYGYPLIPALGAAIMVGSFCGALVAIAALRTRHVYLAILTFGVMQIVAYLFAHWDFVGGLNGITGMMGITLKDVALLALIVLFGNWWLEHSRLGLAMRAVRQDDLVASLLGIGVRQLRLLSFGIGSGIAGLAGALYGHYNFFIDPYTFGVAIGVNMVFFGIVGGMQVWIGPAVGAIILTLIPEYLRDFMPKIAMWRPALYGVIIVLMLVLRPQGLVSRSTVFSMAKWPRRLLRTEERRLEGSDAPTRSLPAPNSDRKAPTRLTIDNVTKTFGGLRALSEISIEISPGILLGLIGPNGAGKTTLFNVITGVFRPTLGKIFIGGTDTTTLGPKRIAELGVARTFQNIRLFKEMTVIEHVIVGQHRNARSGLFNITRDARHLEEKLRAEVDALLKELGLWDVRHRFATELPYAIQRRVEIARALASEPRIFLLDEPTAGMDPVESADVADVIRYVHQRYGYTIVLIEHDMSVVMNVCEKIAVLSFGEKIAEGKPEEIQKNRIVQEAYLGTDEA